MTICCVIRGAGGNARYMRDQKSGSRRSTFCEVADGKQLTLGDMSSTESWRKIKTERWGLLSLR
jgi:hypothetical protein